MSDLYKYGDFAIKIKFSVKKFGIKIGAKKNGDSATKISTRIEDGETLLI